MAITDGLITLAEAKASIYGNEGTAPSFNDSDIEDYVEAATPVIERITGPLVQRNRTFTVDGGEDKIVLPVPFSSVVSVTVDGVAFTNYVYNGASGIIFAGTESASSTFDAGTQNVDVTVAVGSATIPANVKLAARELVRFWWQQGRQANRPGTAEQDSAAAPMGFSVPKRVRELLEPNEFSGFA